MKTFLASLLLHAGAPALAQSPAGASPPPSPPAPESPAPPAPTASASSAPAAPAVPPGIVDGKTAYSLLAQGATVVDVRTFDEFSAGHLPGALHIPYDEIEARIAEIGPKSEAVLVYCKSGRRSAVAARALEKAGFQLVYDLQSVSAWPGPLSK